MKRRLIRIFLPWLEVRRLNHVIDEITDVGVYPKKVIGGPRPYEERNDYQNGWNDACSEMIQRYARADEAKPLPREAQEVISANFWNLIALPLCCLLVSCGTIDPCNHGKVVGVTDIITAAANPPHRGCVAIDSDLLDDPGPFDGLRIWGPRSKFWENGTHLRVRFLGGSSSQQQRAWARFQQVDALVGLTFCFVESGPSDIRVTFTPGGGHWAYLGNSCRGIPQTATTMNLALTAWDSSDEWDRVVVHEILHALGFSHEHQHPSSNIPWDREQVYADYAQTQGWSREQIDRQVLNRESVADWVGTEYDAGSIMEYPINPSHVTDARYAVGWNRTLSEKDIAFLAKTYPTNL